MDRYDNRYSRFVATLKVLFIIGALATLSTVFLLARGPGEAELPFSFQTLNRLSEGPRLESPTYHATTEDGRPVTVSARLAIPKRADLSLVDLQDMQATLVTEERGDVTLTAREGLLDNTNQTADFVGDVVVKTGDGYTLLTDDLSADLNIGHGYAPGRVQINGPGIDLVAGHMDVYFENETPLTVRFKNGVHVIYTQQEN